MTRWQGRSTKGMLHCLYGPSRYHKAVHPNPRTGFPRTLRALYTAVMGHFNYLQKAPPSKSLYATLLRLNTVRLLHFLGVGEVDRRGRPDRGMTEALDS
ncbi:hypothetical protein DPMN_117325 [Dreissena polymorpha]|uniref:Uncharacterized protein n=1 Tax=Dreissena polymorpha TaxID=45954 RepID=A0A9D4QUB9_DREPO|nr:hypothetical protein DPMN_117325 [Dreissena polymorpha]